MIDGSGRPAFAAEVGIRDGCIAALGDLAGRKSSRVVEAPGSVLCPGFIDIHSHSDFTVLIDGRAASKIRQGVTTEVIGQCGGSASPLHGEKLKRIRSIYPDLSVDWRDLREYRRRVEERGTAVNLVPVTGQGNIRGSVIGYREGSPTRDEMKRMIGLLEKELELGSRGLSTGLVYPPGSFTGFDELVEMLRPVSLRGGIYATHMRNESDRVEEAVDEAIRLAEISGISLEISHLKAQGRRNWGRLARCFELIETARGRGVNIHCDRYPYLASATDLDILLPSWASEGGAAVELRRLRDPSVRRRMAAEIRRGDWAEVVVSRVAASAGRELEGMNLREIASARGVSPVECLFDILVEGDLRVEAWFFGMSEENLKTVMRKPYTMIASDASARSVAGALGQGRPHPRAFGTFPRVLGRFVGDKTLGLEEAVFKMTGLPARKMSLEDRGTIREGSAADLVIFDPEKIASRADYQTPKRYPDGIDFVIVNGEVVVENGEHTGRLPGRFL